MLCVELPLVRERIRQGDGDEKGASQNFPCRMERDGEQLLDNLEFRMFAREILVWWLGTGKARKEMVDLICRNDPITLGSVWYDGKI